MFERDLAVSGDLGAPLAAAARDAGGAQLIMVQLVYYESRGGCCRQALRREGQANRVLLFPYEGWARPASITYLILKVPWWSRTRCKVVEVRGSQRTSGRGKIADSGKGRVSISGRFKAPAAGAGPAGQAGQTGQAGPAGPAGQQQTDFRLLLSTDVSNADFHLGYSITGVLERGDRKAGKLEMTHFAMIKRKGY